MTNPDVVRNENFSFFLSENTLSYVTNMFQNRSFLSVAILLSLVCSGPRLWAADAAVTDEQKTQLVSQAELFRKDALKEPAKKEEIKPEIYVKKEEEAPTEAGPTFFVKEVRFEGNTLFQTPALKKFSQPIENQTVSFDELKKVSQMVTNFYRGKGYTTSRAYIPPQKIKDGIANIKIIEAKVGKVFVEGNKHYGKNIYQNAIRFRQSDIFYYPDLEASLYYLNRKQDLKAKAYLIEGEKPMTSDIVLKAEDTRPLHAYYDFSNHGTSLTYRARHGVHVDDANFLGSGDTLNSSWSLAEEAAFAATAVQYIHPVDQWDTTFEMDFSFVKSLLMKHLKSAEVKGKSVSFTPSVTHAFIKTPSLLVEGNAALEIKDSMSIIDDNKTNFDRMRVLKFGPRVTVQDGSGRTIIVPDVHWGIPRFLGSSREADIDASRLNSGGEFIYYTATLARIQRLPESTFLVAKATGQWSSDNLTSVEQFRLGGYSTVRGYPESDSSGDRGYVFSAELSVPPPFIPDGWQEPITKKKWREALRFVGFFEGGKTFIRQRATEDAVKGKVLIGTGFGIRVDLDNTFSLQCDLGFPIGEKSTDENRNQVHLYLRAGF